MMRMMMMMMMMMVMMLWPQLPRWPPWWQRAVAGLHAGIACGPRRGPSFLRAFPLETATADADHCAKMAKLFGSCGRGRENHRFLIKILLKSIDFERRAGSGAAGDRKVNGF